MRVKPLDYLLILYHESEDGNMESELELAVPVERRKVDTLVEWSRGRVARATGRVPRHRGKHTQLLASLSLAGMRAAMILEGSANGAALAIDVEQLLACSLHAGPLARPERGAGSPGS